MKLRPDQLPAALGKKPLPLYWVAGDEPLLVQEAVDAIRRYLRQANYEEREVHNVDRDFSWAAFRLGVANKSLFAASKIVELRLDSAKFGDIAKQALSDYLERPDDGVVVLMTCGRVEGGMLNTKWFKGVEKNAVFVPVWPLTRADLGPWLEKRLRQAGIHADPEAVALLRQRIEGNLLAAMQEIEKIKLLANSPAGETIHLDARTVLSVVADSSRFNAFHLIDAALAGEAARALRILASLQAEGVFPLPILGAITREIRILLGMIGRVEAGEPPASVMQSARVIFHRKKAVDSALQRLTAADLRAMLIQARHIDHRIKGLEDANAWDGLGELLLSLSGARLPA